MAPLAMEISTHFNLSRTVQVLAVQRLQGDGKGPRLCNGKARAWFPPSLRQTNRS
jgi:hypothetical protein